MDGQLKRISWQLAWARKGGAVLALPFLLCAARPLTADIMAAAQAAADQAAPNLDATGMLLVARPEALDDAPKGLGFPTTGAQFTLYGGGASFSKGLLQVGVQAVVGGLSASQGSRDTEWRLRLGNVVFEQRYPYGQFLLTAGTVFSYAQVEGILTAGTGITRYDGQAYGGGLTVGARWPRQTRLGLMARTGYEWLPVSGVWKGEYAQPQPKAVFDLGGPLAQLQLELSF